MSRPNWCMENGAIDCSNWYLEVEEVDLRSCRGCEFLLGKDKR